MKEVELLRHIRQAIEATDQSQDTPYYSAGEPYRRGDYFGSVLAMLKGSLSVEHPKIAQAIGEVFEHQLRSNEKWHAKRVTVAGGDANGSR